jgi:hypothetical protein
VLGAAPGGAVALLARARQKRIDERNRILDREIDDAGAPRR